MRILVAVSGPRDEGCADPIEAATSLPWPKDTEFCVLTVAGNVHPPVSALIPGAMSVSDVQQKTDSTAANLASSSAALFRDRGWHAEGVALEGDPKTKIADYAKEWNADLIVVGACDLPAVERFFVGSVSQSVVKDSPCSVLVVKPRRHWA
jgi:nucleotide-binding universal stress UspA family protein